MRVGKLAQSENSSAHVVGFCNRDIYDSSMLPTEKAFQRSIDKQIAINQLRTPSQRFVALCELLDAARAMAPLTPDAVERRRIAESARQQDRELWRERCRQFIAAERAGVKPRA